jgi:hypothetical protein
MIILSFTGCSESAQSIFANSKVPNNLRLLSETKIDNDDIMYKYQDEGIGVIYVCKNLKTNTVSIATINTNG